MSITVDQIIRACAMKTANYSLMAEVTDVITGSQLSLSECLLFSTRAANYSASL